MLQHRYQFHPNLVLRTPASAFDTAFDEAVLQQQLHDPAFMEALYLASPDLCQECQRWQSGALTDPKKIEKLLGTVARYYARMTSRCTPFGLFAGCSVLNWGLATRITLAKEQNTRHTRLDMHYLCALAYRLSELEVVKERIRYFPNTSLYQIGEEIRYIEHRFVQEERVHQISSAAASEYLQRVIEVSKEGLPSRDIARLLIDDEAELEDALAYVEALIQAQVLVSELEPTVTGPEFHVHLQRVLARLNAAAPAPQLQTLQTLLAQVADQLQLLDRTPINSAAAYEQIVAALLPLGIPIQKNKLFQTDSIRGLADATLGQHLQQPLLEALDLLTYLTPPRKNERLEDFKDRFQARYEGQAVPLLEVLDNESGLRYSDFGKSTYSPLVHDLALAGQAGSRSRSLRQDEVQHFMYQKLREAERNRQYSIEITRAEVQDFAPVANPLPPSLSVMFRLVSEDRILLESVGGSSAVNLLGRFAHAAAAVERTIRDVAEHEQAQNPDVIFAEICHLPVSRIGNILLRPSFRNYEIPYLAQSGLPAQGQLRLQDLTLSMHGRQLVLRSRLTNQVVVPRLGTAHNFAKLALPVYEFLCDLQTQGLQSHLGFVWSSVSLYAKFLPRLTFQQVILQPASWQLDRADLHELLAAPAAATAQCLLALRGRWQLPRFFTLADGDNELLVDADNPTSVGVWLAAIRNRDSIKLNEFLFAGADSPVQDAAGQPYVHQLVALLVRNSPCYTALGMTTASPVQLVREFTMGSEWLYYKFYCGQKVADRVLIEVIRPLTEELVRQGLVDKWFFIRYADPDNHVRLRLHLPDVQRIGAIVHVVNSYVQPYVSNGYIWKTQTDTYRRELERYGSRTMELSESLFYESSRSVLAVLSETADDEESPMPWVWGLHQIDELLDAFECPLAEKLALLHSLKESFAKEFGMNKSLKLQLDAKYRGFRATIQQALRERELTVPANEQVRYLAGEINALGRQGALDVDRHSLLSSYIHMLLNRLIPVDARLHEMVLYDFLHRQYQSQQALQKV